MDIKLEHLKEFSIHIDKIYEKAKKGNIISLNEKLEMHKFYIYAESIINNIKGISKILTIRLEVLERKDVISLITYLESKKIKSDKIMSFLNSNDAEIIKLGIELIKKCNGKN